MAAIMHKEHVDVPPCIVVTKDINLRLKADALGLEAEDYETDRVESRRTLPRPLRPWKCSADALERFRRDGGIEPAGFQPSPNEYVLLRTNGQPSHTLFPVRPGPRPLVP
jgi:PhoH-like ATPase